MSDCIMGKYRPLGEFLRKQGRAEIPLTFAEIEKIVGGKLPAKSQQNRAWWSNNPANNVMTKEWLAAGFRSEKVDIARKRLVFRRTRERGSLRNTGMSEERKKLEGQAAGKGRHPMIGALKGTFSIAPGTDLTAPAWPEWAEFLDKKFGPELKE
jgi:hypothetical protein